MEVGELDWYVFDEANWFLSIVCDSGGETPRHHRSQPIRLHLGRTERNLFLFCESGFLVQVAPVTDTTCFCDYRVIIQWPNLNRHPSHSLNH